MKYLISWTIYLIGAVAVLGTDYALRMSDADIATGGMSVVLTTVCMLVVGASAIFVLYRALQVTQLNTAIKLTIITVNIALGFIVFAALALYYSLEFGLPM